MKKLSLITGLLFSCLMHSQNPTFQWVKSIGGATDENGVHSTMDGSGNIYTTGSFEGTVDFDPGSGISNLTSSGLMDIFIQKLDANGNFIWAKRFGGVGDDISTAINHSTFGDIFITGNYEGVVDFNPGSGFNYQTSEGGSDVFVQKLNVNGELGWVKSIGGTLNDFGGMVKTDALGNVYLLQNYSGAVDFDPGRDDYVLTSSGGLDICIEKLSPFGDLVWAKTIGGSSDDYGSGLEVDNTGNVYVTGNFQGSVDFDPGTGINLHVALGTKDLFVEKLNSNGTLEWVSCLGSSFGSSEVTSIALDLQGNPYTIGTFDGSITYPVPEAAPAILTSAGGSDVFIQKFNPYGEIIWMKSIGGTKNEKGKQVHIDFLDNIFVSGEYDKTILNDPGTAAKGITMHLKGFFVHQINQSGFTLWEKQFRNSVGVWINSMSTDYSGNLFISGKFKGSVDFDSGSSVYSLTSSGNMSNYTLKLGHSITNISEAEENTLDNAFTIYPNPAKNKLTIKLHNTHEYVNIELYDVIGNLVYSENNTNSNEISVALNQPNGVYFVNILVDDKRIVKRLIIE